MKYILALFFTISNLISLSKAIEFDYCVGDPNRPTSPVGYSCKEPAAVTVDDFIYSGFRGSERTTFTNVFKANVTFAFANTFPGVNGLGLSMTRVDIGVGGVVPAHTHRSSEIIFIAKGIVMAGFIDTRNIAYFKRLVVGDVMIFPTTLIHFQINVGPTTAIVYASYNSQNPGIQLVTTALFGSNLPTDIIVRISNISALEAARLKLLFGGIAP